MTSEMEKPSTPDIFAHQLRRKMWMDVLKITLILFIALTGITVALDGVLDMRTVSKGIGGTAALLIGSSFALSGFCFYFNFLDTKIGYRKYLGLAGYFAALSYSLTLLLIEPERYFFGFRHNLLTADVLLGLTAMAGFTFMALISNRWAMQKLGAHRWRVALRVGYLVWPLLAIRAYLIEQDIWMQWLVTLDGFPPPRMLLSLFVAAVIAFRISVEIAKHARPTAATPNLTASIK